MVSEELNSRNSTVLNNCAMSFPERKGQGYLLRLMSPRDVPIAAACATTSFPCLSFSRDRSIPRRVAEKPSGDGSSSACTDFINSQRQQLCSFSAYVPCTLPPQSEPAIAQHALPAFFPSCVPSRSISVVTGQMPSSAVLWPPGCLPHFLCSQQFSFFFPMPSK